MKASFSTCAVPSAVLLACLALAGCGGGGGGATSTAISGAVIDGYIQGATVCLDVNVNQTCDAGEPSATTAADGSYKLDTSSLTTAQIKAAHLLTNVPTSAKDADDGGKTLADVRKKGFSFMAPAAAYVKDDGSAVTGAVISPLTTLLSHEMISSGTPLAAASTNVVARLALAPDTDLTQDFVAKKDVALMTKAQMLTVAIGEVKAEVLADTAAAATDKQAFFAALEYLQTQVADLQKAFDAAKTAKANEKAVDWVKEAIKAPDAKPDTAYLVAVSKKSTESSAVGSLVALIEQGFYSADYVLEPIVTNGSTASYYKIIGSVGKLAQEQDYDLAAGKWVKNSANGEYDFRLTSTGWKQDKCAAGESITYSGGSDGVATVKDCTGMTARVTARVVDAGGKTLKSLGLMPPPAFEATTMPAGSQLYWFDFALTEDEYTLYTGNSVGKFTNGSKVEFATLDNFITAFTQTGVTPSSSAIQAWSGLYFSFAGNGRVTLWDRFNSPKEIGTATYTRRTFGGVEVLTINAKAPYNSAGEFVTFAVKDGKVYGGSFSPSSARSDVGAGFNKTMIKALMAAGKKPAVID